MDLALIIVAIGIAFLIRALVMKIEKDNDLEKG